MLFFSRAADETSGGTAKKNSDLTLINDFIENLSEIKAKMYFMLNINILLRVNTKFYMHCYLCIVQCVDGTIRRCTLLNIMQTKKCQNKTKNTECCS